MVTIVELLKKEQSIIKELDVARAEAIEEKLKSEQDEATLWVTTNFKDKGFTNDKMRSAYVTQQKQLLYPNFYEQKRAKVNNLENQLKFIKQVISVMIQFEIKEIDGLDFEEEKAEEKEKGKEEERAKNTDEVSGTQDIV